MINLHPFFALINLELITFTFNKRKQFKEIKRLNLTIKIDFDYPS